MKKTLLLTAILLSIFAAGAQDRVLLSSKWQTFFREYDRKRLANFTSVEYNKRFITGHFYEGLLIFKDTTQESRPVFIAYPGFEYLCDAKLKLLVTDHPDNPGYEVDKKVLQYFVFDEMLFAFDDLNRKKFKLQVAPNFWSVLLVDGPVRITRHAYISTYGGKPTKIDGGVIYKDEETVASDLYSFGGLSFKKGASKIFSDHPEIPGKITSQLEGYTRKEVLDIIIEYNNWVKQTNPEGYKKSLLMAKYIE